VYCQAVKCLVWKAVAQGVGGIVFFALLIFLSAGTFDYWQGWTFLAVFTALTAAFTVYLFLYDVPLLERRMNAGPWKEKEVSQKIIVSLIVLSFFAFIALAVLDHRFGLSPIPAWLSFTGEAIIALSFLFIFWVARVNSWAAANIAVAPGQKVVSSGPYAYVRHPMYAGTMGLFVGIPLALGSWWTITLITLFVPILLWRLLDEERVLRRDLHGYNEYTKEVKYRLLPGIF
jgi:protein-S-isoprenylcysteine O-methyltransferase Ste14